MIFRTITDESTGAVKSIGLFGKTLNELKSSFANIKTNGLLNSIFKTSSIDTKAIDAYNKAITEATKNNVSMADKQQIMQTAMEGTNKETARLIGSTKGAEVGLKELKVAQDATTLSAKAGQVALKGLAMAGNMLLMWGISEAISLAITGIEHLINAEKYEQQAFENATETAKKYVDQIKETREESEKTSETAEKIANRYAQLAQGVNVNTNKNMSLSNDDYEEFLNLNKQLAELFPTLTKGYDENGNAILGLSGGVDTVTESIRKLVEQQERLARQDLKDNLEKYVNGDEDSEGQLKSIEGQKKKVEKSQSKLDELNDRKNGIINGDTIYNEVLSDIDYEKYLDSVRNSFGEEAEKAIASITDIQYSDKGATKYSIDYSKLQLSKNDKNKILKSYQNAYKDLKSEAETAQSELDNKNKELSQQMMIWVSELDVYEDNKSLQNPITNLVSGIKWSNLGLEDYDSVKSYIQKNILTPLQTVCDDPDAKAKVMSSYSSLFSIDFSKLSLVESNKKINELLKIIVSALFPELDGNELQKKIDEYRKSLGFDKYKDAQDKLTNSIGNGKKDKDGSNKGIAQSVDEVKILTDYTKGFNQEQTEIWLNATQGAKGAQDAIKKYELELKKGNKTDSFKESWKNLGSETKEKLLELARSGEISTKTLKSTKEYKKLLDETGENAKTVLMYITDMLDVQEKMAAFQQGVGNLETAFQEFKEKKFVTAETLEALPDAFKSLKGFDLFSQIVGDPTSGKNKIKNAFDDLVTEYAKTQGTLKGVTEKTKESAIANLKDAGVINARDVVESYIKHCEEMTSQLNNLQEKTADFNEEEFNSFIKYLNGKGTASSELMSKIGNGNAEMINKLSSQYKDDLANWLKLCEKKKDAYNLLAKAIGGSTPEESKSNYNKLINKDESKLTDNDMGAYEYANKAGFYVNKKGEITSVAEEKANEKLEELKFDTIDLDFDLDFTPKNTKQSSSSEKKTKQFYDWIEVKLDRINRKIERFKNTMEVLLKLQSKFSSGRSALSQLSNQYAAQDKAYNRYIKQANKYVNKNGKLKGTNIKASDVRNGKIDITKLNDKQQTAVDNYKQWYDKAIDVNDAKTDTILAMRDLAEQMYNLPIDEASEAVEKFSNAISNAEKEIEFAQNAEDKKGYRQKIVQSAYDTYEEQKRAYDWLKKKLASLRPKDGKLKGTNIKVDGETKITNLKKKTDKNGETYYTYNGKKLSGKELRKIKEYNAAVDARAKAEQTKTEAELDLVSIIRETAVSLIQDVIDDIETIEDIASATSGVWSSYRDMREAMGNIINSTDYDGEIDSVQNESALAYKKWQEAKGKKDYWNSLDDDGKLKELGLSDSDIANMDNNSKAKALTDGLLKLEADVLGFESEYYQKESQKHELIKQKNEQELRNLESQSELIESISSKYEALLSLRDAQGQEFRTQEEAWQQLKNSENELENLQQQRAMALKLYQDASAEGRDADALQYSKDLNELDTSILNKKAQQEEIVNSLYDEQIYKVNQYKEALQKANEEQDKRLQLERAQYNLLKAMNQKTQKIFNGQEFV